MDVKKAAFFSASWLIFGVAALSGAAFAAEPSAGKPVAAQVAHEMNAHSGEDEHLSGMKCDHQASMMKAHMGGMMCDHKGGMMCDHKGGMMCDHKGGMMCDHKGGMMCDHKGGMMGDHDSGMMMGRSRMHMVMSLDLSEEQVSRINKLSDELKHNNWATKGLIMDESVKLRDLYEADKPNVADIGKVYQRIFDLRRKMIEATIATQNRIEELLTPEQRTQLKDMRRQAKPGHGPMH